MKLYLASPHTLLRVSSGLQMCLPLLDEKISCGPGRMREGRNQCDCSWPGSPHGGVGGYDPIIREHKPFILESFFYADDDTERLIPHYGDFLLDSGAFTFMGGFDFKNNQGIRSLHQQEQG